MKKRLCLALSLLLALLILSGCATSTNPLIAAEATNVPGLNMRLHAAEANNLGSNVIDATLYFRYLGEPMLAAESRRLTVRRDETAELTIIRALIEGPSAGRSDLGRLLPEDLVVESAVSRDSTLFITFTNALLKTGDIPSGWESDEAWTTEAPLRRYLAMMSIVNSITESFTYSGVQILLHGTGSVQTSLRLENSFFLTGKEGLSDVLTRDESCLLTPKNAIDRLLTAWQQRDYEHLRLYLTDATDETPLPAYAQLSDMLQGGAVLLLFETSSGSVSVAGTHAVISASLTLRKPDGSDVALTGYPLRLYSIGGVWLLPIDELDKLLSL